MVASGWLIAQNSDGFDPEELAVTAPVVASGGPSYPTPDIFRWDMTNGSGTTVTATVGPNGDTDAAWVSGWVTGNALDYNGTSGDTATASSVTYGTNKITICFPLWLDSTNTAQNILESSALWDDQAHSFIVVVQTTGTLLVGQIGTVGNYRTASCTSKTTGAWFSVLIVIDHSSSPGTAKMFFDGVEQTLNFSGSILTAASLSDQVLYVGARNRGSIWMDGKMGKLWIYSGDRSSQASEIADAMK